MIAEETKEKKQITNGEIVSSVFFKQAIESQFEQILAARNARPEAKNGYRYKRSWIDQLKDSQNFNSAFFLEHSISVLQKKSSLPVAIREPLYSISVKAFLIAAKKLSE